MKLIPYYQTKEYDAARWWPNQPYDKDHRVASVQLAFHYVLHPLEYFKCS